MRIALFAPCFVDQLYPRVAIATLRLLERLGVQVEVPDGAICCGQPPANAGFAHDADAAMDRFIRVFAPYHRVIVISGSCALHTRKHGASRGAVGARVADAVVELSGFLHDDVGVERIRALGARSAQRVAVHIGCHGLRGLRLATPSELRLPQLDKVRAVVGAVAGASFVELERPDECCGFGGTFSVDEAAVSTRMGADRLRDYSRGKADVVVSTDVSCMMHLSGVSRARGGVVPFLHIAEFLDGAVQ